jgi:hypothetical protein
MPDGMLRNNRHEIRLSIRRRLTGRETCGVLCLHAGNDRVDASGLRNDKSATCLVIH